MAGGEKTEAPTPRRREEARKRGNVPRSAELTSALALLAGALIIKYVGANVLAQVIELMGGSFRALTAQEWTVSGVLTYSGSIGMLYLMAMTPIFVTLIVVGVAGNLAQSGLVLTMKPLSPDFSRIDPSKGFQRMLSQRTVVELVKSVAKLGIVAYVVYQALQGRYLQVISLSGTDIRGAAGMIADVAMEIVLKAGFTLLGVAALDYGYQRWQHSRSLRMTKDEVKEEVRQSEGDPKVRSKIRQKQMQSAARRMMHDVPTSDVVVTNPTHVAVAIRYRPESMRAPQVTAKGQRFIAEKIKEIAREHGVPIIENKPLARALFQSVEIGSEIPPALYHAVAEVLAFIYSLKRQRRLGGQQLGS